MTSASSIAALWVGATLLVPIGAEAQAWVPSAGTGFITVATQAIENTGHILTGGMTIPFGKSRTGGIYLEGEYAFTDRLSIAVGIPFVFAKYLGPRLDPEPPMVRPVDLCYCWQSGWQDFGFTGRFNLMNGSTAVTPSVSVGVPSHSYEYRGEAVVGRNLKEVRLAMDVGQRLEAISPRLAVQARYSYAIVERVAGVSNNRSNASGAAAFRLSEGVSLQATLSRQVTHGGLRAGDSPPPPEGVPWGEIVTPELFEQHDRLIRDNNWRAGAGATLSLSHADLFVSYLEFLGGTDTHAGRSFTAGVSFGFAPRTP